jgi:cytochrome c biogenesis protein
VLRATRFFPDVVRAADGRLFPRSDDLQNPALELELLHPQRAPWRGWYVLREGVPAPLGAAGVRLEPIEPLAVYASVLTINRDPGAGLAKLGAVLMGVGVLFALASFYYKRARGDRPDIA